MKIGSESVEIKPLDIENKKGTIRWKRSINISRAEELVDIILLENNEQAISELEKMCLKISKANDVGLYKAFKQQFDIDLLQTGFESSQVVIEDVFKEIRLGKSELLMKVKELMASYMLYYFDRYEQALSYLENAKTDFVYTIEKVSETSAVKLDVDRVKSIVENTAVSFLDGSYFEDSFSSSGANHSAGGEVYIGLDGFRSKEEILYMYFHELLHAISTDYSKIVHLGKRNVPASSQSIGVDFSGNFENPKRGFVWLNEAFTDLFAVGMISQMNEGRQVVNARYTSEIKLLNLLSEKGQVNLLKKIYGIYFRHIKKGEAEDDSATDEWKSFNKEMDVVFGPRFLVKLDLFIEKHGIEKAIDIIEKWRGGEINLGDLK